MSSDENLSYAKQQLGVKAGEHRILGLKWDKNIDTFAVTFPQDQAPPTKRVVLGKLAKIYDPLGFVSPITLKGKQIYREICEQKHSWDAPLPEDLMSKWLQWESKLPAETKVTRSLATYEEPIESIDLHAFGDASVKGVSACVYAVVTQSNAVSQGLVAAKSRLAKQKLSIPRLELVSAHMALNLIINVQEALEEVSR